MLLENLSKCTLADLTMINFLLQGITLNDLLNIKENILSSSQTLTEL